MNAPTCGAWPMSRFTGVVEGIRCKQSVEMALLMSRLGCIICVIEGTRHKQSAERVRPSVIRCPCIRPFRALTALDDDPPARLLASEYSDLRRPSHAGRDGRNRCSGVALGQIGPGPKPASSGVGGANGRANVGLGVSVSSGIFNYLPYTGAPASIKDNSKHTVTVHTLPLPPSSPASRL